MPLHTVEPLRLYRQIAGQIAALIDNGEFPAGSRLPAERELASLLGVSRTSVREAIISLEIAGRVEVRVGSGIFVAQPGAAQIAGLADDGPSPFELLAARRLIEGEVVALAARTIKKADIAQLRETVVRMREDADDFQFGRGFSNSQWRSFPSGHSTTAFAAAAAVTDETTLWWPRSTWFVGPVMYGGATMVALSRMYHNRHWASDVAVGALIGTFSGKKVVLASHSNPGNRIDRVMLGTFVAPNQYGSLNVGWKKEW